VAYNEESCQVSLQLQALPFNGNHVKSNPSFTNDELAVVVIKSFPIEMEEFDGSLAAGPVPIFVSEKPEETAQALNSNPARAHKMCQVKKIATLVFLFNNKILMKNLKK
jgi:hypothetical protein